MALTTQPFIRYKTDEERSKEEGRTFTVYLNKNEWEQLQQDMKTLRQVKDSTALKQLWQVGRNLLYGDTVGLLARTIHANDTRNKKNRTDPDIELAS